MLGAIAGDIIGSRFEHEPIKTEDFSLFHDSCRLTDDTVLTVAVADVLLYGRDWADTFKTYYARYPDAGYGLRFSEWAASSRREPYNSWGNGSAMRVSPVGFAATSLEEAQILARQSAEVTHSHPEGIRGAQAIASAVFLARTGNSKKEIKAYMESEFHYSLDETVDSLRPGYGFDASCQGSVPPAITAFLDSKDYEDAVRKAISLGGDSDTLACMAGAIAQAHYGGVPGPILDRVYPLLDSPLRRITTLFCNKYGCV